MMSVYHANNVNIRQNENVAVSQVTTNIPVSFDGKSSRLAIQDAIDDLWDITELDEEKRGPALRNRLEGDATT